ncbi:AGE family epimerase/isomerase [Rubrivivax gelatinosus]|uniref:Mannose/cellobiose epimerase-like protein (N-acyl-D-glucosamine 2-epimerase family) n=1 Tax=Rubrivivax gelatinosus TaxID=28068 RepID=A0A4R2MJK5_RUBGE|nr:AGE family epimerase/isomerase [Rubrivivax gelatinosus]MBK1688008.1 N-acylglucosamine 2-epimerase [Rubrivivax gelatinosus]TCO99292.1 mannose/cellobiose epimerase-like protein (N-acyl-D-glucosamine 2-epimerase family) [Rubrivivax gelatinosus]
MSETEPDAPDGRARPDFRSPEFLRAHVRDTLAFYAGRATDPTGGFFHFFRDDGTVYDRRTRHLVSSTRFVVVHALAARHFGSPAERERVRHGLRFLHEAHRKADGGYAWTLDWHEGRAQLTDPTNHCYGLAFVLLAHAHALMAGVDEARAGLDDTVALMERRFWEPAAGLYADEADAGWRLAPYRGQNANMHACEAMLAAHEATGDRRHLQRALGLAHAVTQRLAACGHGLIWEHWRREGDVPWTIDWDYNRFDRSNIFRPWGFQTGHLTEWAKLLLQLDARLGERAPAWLAETAARWFDTALAHGWDAQHGGLVYGFGPDRGVCDGDKYHWVQAESLAAAAWLAVRLGDKRFWGWYDRIWAYVWRHFVDHEHGAWYRILGPDNRRLTDEKSPAGKTDYHDMGACWDVLRALGALER